MVVSDGAGDPERVVALGCAAAAGGAWAYQIREPRLEAAALLGIVARLEAQAPALRVIVSDRADVALASGASGLQLGEQGLPLSRVRRWVGDTVAIGRSVHDLAGARAALEDGAAWLIFGHVYATDSKAGYPARGPKGLAAAARGASRPVLAIGGITAARVPEILAHGARGVAVIGAVARAADPVAATRELVAALETSNHGSR
jgi:thiamine-phosphate pyrophosphorylase